MKERTRTYIHAGDHTARCGSKLCATHYPPRKTLIINTLQNIISPNPYYVIILSHKAVPIKRTRQRFPKGNCCVLRHSYRQSYPDLRSNSPFTKSDRAMHEYYRAIKTKQNHTPFCKFDLQDKRAWFTR